MLQISPHVSVRLISGMYSYYAHAHMWLGPMLVDWVQCLAMHHAVLMASSHMMYGSLHQLYPTLTYAV